MILVSLCLIALLCAKATGEQQHVIATNEASRRTKDASQQQDALALNFAPDWLLAKPRKPRNSNASESLLDAKLLKILHRIGPDMKPASGFRDYNDISVQVSKRAWQLLHERVVAVVDERVSNIWPLIESSLNEANVSDKCVEACQTVADRVRALDGWAVQMINSWGSFPPSGIFEGSLGDIGSYHGCVNIRQNSFVNHAHYCTVAFRPVIPSRKDYDLIINQEPEELLKTFDELDMFSLLLGKAQYYHYVYFKLGTCFPIQCSPVDVKKISHLIARRWYFLSGPVKCHSKYETDYDAVRPETGKPLVLSSRDLNDGVYIWKPHMTGTQLVALLILITLVSLAMIFTLADLCCRRIPALVKDYSSAYDEETNDRKYADPTITNGKVSSLLEDSTRIALNQSVNNNRIELSDLNETKNLCAKTPTSNGVTIDESIVEKKQPVAESFLTHLIKDCSIITNTQEFFSISQEQLRNDILCMNGLRCITMSWIIIAHTIQYNDWSAFARIYEVETHLKSLVNQPLFNASYLVDTFFLISGLLTSYSVFRPKVKLSNDQDGKLVVVVVNKQNVSEDFSYILGKFSCKSYLIGRYLRLTPQIMLVSILFILLPLVKHSGGPHWYTMTGEYSENCAKNWWVNLLHLQAFYRSDEMCNFVCWWISVDMFYHIIALVIIMTILNYGSRIVLRLCLALVSINLVFQASKHYELSLPPNLFSTIPQTGAMWSDMTLKFFWTPVAHTFPFLFGFYTGYKLAIMKPSQRENMLTIRRALIGWLLAISSFFLVLYGTYFWVIGKLEYSQPMATCFYLTTQLIWSLSLSWIIIACEFGFGGFIASLLSCKLFLVLGKASYFVYLSHFLILFTFFGSQNLLVEPTQLMIGYILIGNICLSMVFGSVLCIVFEMPWLKLQRRVMSKIN